MGAQSNVGGGSGSSVSEETSQRHRGTEGRRHKREPDNIDESELDDSDETADVDELVEPESGLAVGNTRSGNCAKLGVCRECSGDENDFSDGGNVVGSGGLGGGESGLGVCDNKSEGRMRLESGAGRIGTVDGGLVDSGEEHWSWCALGWFAGRLGSFGGE